MLCTQNTVVLHHSLLETNITALSRNVDFFPTDDTKRLSVQQGYGRCPLYLAPTVLPVMEIARKLLTPGGVFWPPCRLPVC
jgi:hypothetical protein